MSKNNTDDSLRIDLDRCAVLVFWSFLLLEIVIVLLDAGISYGRLIDYGPIRRLVNITREDSIGTWFAIIQTLAVSVVLFLIYLRMKSTEQSTWRRRGWGLLSLFFFYICFDDGTKFHERIGTATKYITRDLSGEGGSVPILSTIMSFPGYTWQPIFVPMFAVAGVLMLYFLWRELDDKSLRTLLLLALSMYGVAIGLDFVEGIESTFPKIAESLEVRTYTISHFSKSIEEFLEMLGTTLFLVVFLKHLKLVAGGWTIRIDNRE